MAAGLALGASALIVKVVTLGFAVVFGVRQRGKG